MADNMTDQIKVESLSGLMRVFDLLSDENFESSMKKVELLYDIYGLDSELLPENWNDLAVQVIAKEDPLAVRIK